jgi:hypothetical protein
LSGAVKPAKHRSPWPAREPFHRRPSGSGSDAKKATASRVAKTGPAGGHGSRPNRRARLKPAEPASPSGRSPARPGFPPCFGGRESFGERGLWGLSGALRTPPAREELSCARMIFQASGKWVSDRNLFWRCGQDALRSQAGRGGAKQAKRPTAAWRGSIHVMAKVTNG